MKHMIDGYSRAHPPSNTDGALLCLWRRIPDSLGLETAQNLLLYLGCFGLVFIIAIFNPKSFLLVLEVVTSLALNIEAGAGVGVMFYVARSLQSDDAIPTPLSRIWDVAWVPITIFFLAAVGYDVVTTLLEYAGTTATGVVCAIIAIVLVIFTALKCYYRSCTMEGIIGVSPALLGHSRILNESEDEAWAIDSSSHDSDNSGGGGFSGLVATEDAHVFEVTLPEDSVTKRDAKRNGAGHDRSTPTLNENGATLEDKLLASRTTSTSAAADDQHDGNHREHMSIPPLTRERGIEADTDGSSNVVEHQHADNTTQQRLLDFEDGDNVE
ncbi:hypothetical protein PTSG_07424 [Salpingoeca rosetta]|uniref:Uncharacterized protein n=1 Tax=Salpingoeca rosetta (strain ATCC 50818 / BSB-021) TaxID=946362 RepID=F2UIN6_SALR5|nr:uncharacterized protein PTSG_07424 [Salpingoeca rosetta]EGD77085.1 hypothetical protein PTSG_07424 [Salpingoeca rosetta]|eukprot:XP_004990924.1 hypothetical protein PTSG_07424 [Salpingoeca rosetta]